MSGMEVCEWRKEQILWSSREQKGELLFPEKKNNDYQQSYWPDWEVTDLMRALWQAFTTKNTCKYSKHKLGFSYTHLKYGRKD